MKYIRMLFPGIVMQTQEGANMIITFLLRYNFFNEKMGENPYLNDNKFKTVAKVLTLIGRFLMEFLKKLAFVIVTALLPWFVISRLCPLIEGQRELFVIYCYFVLCTFCGTFTNTRLFTMSDRDSFLIDKAAVNQAQYYFGKVVYRMVVELVFATPALVIVGVSFGHAVGLALLTASVRPFGEVFAIVLYAVSRNLHYGKSAYDGILIAISVLVAYLVPYVNRRMNLSLYVLTNPVVIVVAAVFAFLSLYVMWNYKLYAHISRDMIMLRRED